VYVCACVCSCVCGGVEGGGRGGAGGRVRIFSRVQASDLVFGKCVETIKPDVC
jgi:hypothetical protein